MSKKHGDDARQEGFVLHSAADRISTAREELC